MATIDRLFQEWQRLGGAVLLAAADGTVPTRSTEQVIADSTAHCRESGRLTWVVLDWLVRHAEQLDDRELLENTSRCGDLSVLGLLCDAAYQRRPDPRFLRLMSECKPQPEITVFFHRVAQSPLASRLARENALEIFRRWNYLCEELRYL